MALRILAAWYLLGQDQGYPKPNIWSWDNGDHRNLHVNVQGDHASLIREIGAASVVLLKNVNWTLPLVAPKTIAIIGTDAKVSPKVRRNDSVLVFPLTMFIGSKRMG